MFSSIAFSWITIRNRELKYLILSRIQVIANLYFWYAKFEVDNILFSSFNEENDSQPSLARQL